MRNGQVHRKVKGKWENNWEHTQHKDICKTQRVHVAYYSDYTFDIDTENNSTMVEYPIRYSIGSVYTYEILSSFFLSHNLIPIWYHVNISSRLDNETGIWSGAVGMVSEIWIISACHMSV